MSRLRTFIKQNTLWLGLLTVVVPLLIILALQYRSLARLQQLSMVADKWRLKDYLWSLSNEIQDNYQNRARKILDISPHGLTRGVAEEAVLHFRKHDWEGAARLFVVDFSVPDEAEVLFYNRRSSLLEPDPDCPDTRAVNVACAPWKILGHERAIMESQRLTGMVTDHKDRVLLQPLVDARSRLVGMAGMLLDTEFFVEKYLPETIRHSLAHAFSEHEQQNLIIAVHDSSGRLVSSSQPLEGKGTGVSLPMPYIFRDWNLEVRSRYLTGEQWAGVHFGINLCLSLFMTVVLIGGMSMSLRIASRQMKLSQMKADFVSNVSHELRTPLASIRVFGEFLRLGRVKDSEKISEYGEYIENESRRLTQLINNILDFSKIESAQKKYSFCRTDLESVIREALKTLDVRLKQDGFTLQWKEPESSLPEVILDRDAMTQALINLLDNAVKYSGSARDVILDVKQVENWIIVSVSDRGIGIPREEQGKIFEKFYRVSTGLIHDVKGSGLGLSLVKHIAEAHRGKVTVRSQPGQGATFSLHLPVAPVQLSAREPLVTSEQTPAHTT